MEKKEKDVNALQEELLELADRRYERDVAHSGAVNARDDAQARAHVGSMRATTEKHLTARAECLSAVEAVEQKGEEFVAATRAEFAEADQALRAGLRAIRQQLNPRRAEVQELERQEAAELARIQPEVNRQTNILNSRLEIAARIARENRETVERVQLATKAAA